MAKNKNFTAAANKLFFVIQQEIATNLSKIEISGSNGVNNDKQFKGFLMAIKSVILFVVEGNPLFEVDTHRTLKAATLANANKKSVLESNRKLFVSKTLTAIEEYRIDVQKSSKDPVSIENETVETIKILCINFSKRGLVQETALKKLEKSVFGQVAAT